MISSNAVKFFPFVLLVLVVGSSCRFWQTAAPTGSQPAGEIKSEIPFETKEPDIFQAEIMLTNYVNGTKSERVIKAARNGVRLRYDYPANIAFLQINEKERFSIETQKKIYARNRNGGNAGNSGETFNDFLTTEWLNEKRGAKFENLGSENGLAKYRVLLDENLNSEILIYIDENLKIPVKQEFYAVSGEQKTLVYSVELKNVKPEAGDSFFELPKDYKEVSLEEFQEEIRRKRNSN